MAEGGRKMIEKNRKKLEEKGQKKAKKNISEQDREELKEGRREKSEADRGENFEKAQVVKKTRLKSPKPSRKYALKINLKKFRKSLAKIGRGDYNNNCKRYELSNHSLRYISGDSVVYANACSVNVPQGRKEGI